MRVIVIGATRPEFLNLIPEIKGLRFQVVHSYDVGEAYRLALPHDVRGAFNLAADRVLDAQEIGRVLNSLPVPVPVQLARVGARLSWQPLILTFVDQLKAGLIP
jgi:UDP-glucose 4-epimerase